MRGLVLLIVALIISAIVVPVGFMYQLLTTCLNAVNKYLFRIAKSIDQTGNSICEKLFNDTLLKKTAKHHFGNEDETISSVLGKNKKAKTLTMIGKWLAWLLNRIEADHVEKAIGH